MARTSLKSLIGNVIDQVKDSPVPIKSLEYDPETKRVKLEFFQLPTVSTAGPDPAATPTKYVEGTMIPDDDSLLSPLDLSMANIPYTITSEDVN